MNPRGAVLPLATGAKMVHPGSKPPEHLQATGLNKWCAAVQSRNPLREVSPKPLPLDTLTIWGAFLWACTAYTIGRPRECGDNRGHACQKRRPGGAGTDVKHRLRPDWHSAWKEFTPRSWHPCSGFRATIPALPVRQANSAHTPSLYRIEIIIASGQVTHATTYKTAMWRGQWMVI